MKIFIFSESEEAAAFRDAERLKGVSAYLRNPGVFKPQDFDASCDVAYTDEPTIAEAFVSAGVKAEGFPWAKKQVKDVPMVTNFDAEAEIEAQQKAAPKKPARKK